MSWRVVFPPRPARRSRLIRWNAALSPTGRDPMATHQEALRHLSGVTLVWDLARDGATARLQVAIRNESTQTIRVDALRIRFERADIGPGVSDWHMWRNGTQSWSGTRGGPVATSDPDLPIGIRRTTTDPKHGLPTASGHVRSAWMTVIANAVTSDTIGVASLNNADAFHYIDLAAPDAQLAHLDLFTDGDDIELEPNRSTILAHWYLAIDDSGSFGTPNHMLKQLASVSGQTASARLPSDIRTGWCSWYHYFADVRASDIAVNLAQLPQATGSIGLDYLMVDDGHQAEIGDWDRRSDGFSNGMSVVADQIRAKGLKPGLWLAPFLVGKRSRLVGQHPEWLLSAGRTPTVALINPAWGPQRIFALDTTRPDVLSWLEELAATVRGWGFEVLKLDFLYAGALPGRRLRRDVTRAQALRMGLDAFRRGAGEDAYLIGCGCPLGPAIGAVDAMRIGPDVEPRWTTMRARTVQRDLHGISTRHALRNVVSRSFMHGRLWVNDPDCLTLRPTETELDDDERFTIATVMGLSGGLLVCSDDLTTWTSRQRDLWAWAASLRGGDLYIPELAFDDMPDLLCSTFEDRVVIARLNTSEHPRHLRIDVARCVGHTPDLSGPVTDAVTGEPLDINGGIVDVGFVPAHGTRVISLHR
ncbi:MAG: alpha-galactosidase [Acidimicrobiia bacterium]|nr:alpha-galactosidase [Acidimicrobiia bacterium]